MSRSTACQFRGEAQILSAYANNGVAAWSLCNGPNMLFKYEGADIAEGEQELRSFLQMLKKGESQAIYTLKLYEDHKTGAKIKANTPHDLSFNFSLWQDDDDVPYNRRRSATSIAMEERMDKLEGLILKLTPKEEEEEEEKEVSGIGAVMAGLVSMPAVQEQIGALASGVVRSLLNWLPSMSTRTQAVAGIPGQQEEQEAVAEEEVPAASPEDIENAMAWQALPVGEQRKILTAIRKLAKRDPKLGDHLIALAELPDSTFKMAIKML